jgi:multiple sugar transport system substrate-binding protein
MLVLTACGGDDDADDATPAAGADGEDEAGEQSADDVEIRFSWWGSDSRHEETQQIIDLFEAEYPHITVVPDFTDWGSYWDRLATATAGGNSPDVMTQEERYMTDYAMRGQLLDLNDLDVDLSSIDPLALGGGIIDGAQYGVATGVNAFSIVADPELFADAGVDFPDDTSWTWADFAAVAAAFGDDHYGVQPEGSNEAGFNVFARQRGEALYNADGSLGFSAETLAEWWQIHLDAITDGSAPSATELLEIEGPDTSLVATGRGAMAFYWTNQLGALSGTAEHDLALLRHPGESSGAQPGMYLKPAMFYSVSSQTDHPEEAALFVDFLLNSQAAAEIQLTDRGLPANLQIREAITPLLPDTENQVVEFMAEITPDLADPPPPPPNGAGEIPGILTRLWEEVIFERMTPLEAAEQFITEAEAATAS